MAAPPRQRQAAFVWHLLRHSACNRYGVLHNIWACLHLPRTKPPPLLNVSVEWAGTGAPVRAAALRIATPDTTLLDCRPQLRAALSRSITRCVWFAGHGGPRVRVDEPLLPRFTASTVVPPLVALAKPPFARLECSRALFFKSLCTVPRSQTMPAMAVAVTTSEQCVWAWCVVSGARLWKTASPFVTRGHWFASCVAADGVRRRLAVGDTQGRVHLMHADAGVQTACIHLPRNAATSNCHVRSVAFVQGGRTLAVFMEGQDLVLCDVASRGHAVMRVCAQRDPMFGEEIVAVRRSTRDGRRRVDLFAYGDERVVFSCDKQVRTVLFGSWLCTVTVSSHIVVRRVQQTEKDGVTVTDVWDKPAVEPGIGILRLCGHKDSLCVLLDNWNVHVLDLVHGTWSSSQCSKAPFDDTDISHMHVMPDYDRLLFLLRGHVRMNELV
jgi:hypothetical protein